MTRSNSIPTQDASLELYGPSPLGSTLSLSERPRSMGMVRSGSFRDKDSDEGKPSVHAPLQFSQVYLSRFRRKPVAGVNAVFVDVL